MTTKDAATRLGVNVPKFFRLAATHGVNPVVEAAGIRGPKFWDPADINRLAEVAA